MIDVLESICQDVAAGRLSKAVAVERFKGLAAQRMSIADYPGETYQPQTYDDLLDAIAQAGLAGAAMVIDDIRQRLSDRLFLHFSQGLTEETIAEARAIIAETEPLLAGTLSDTLIASWIIGMDSVVRQIPDDIAADIWPTPTTDYMNEGPPGEPPFDAMAVLFPGDDGGARVRFPAIDEAVANLQNRRVLRRADFDMLSAEARKEAFTVAGQDSVETIGRIRDLVTDLVEQGPSLEEFNARLDSVLTDSKAPMNPWHRETVYRTNVQSAYSRGQDRINDNEMVADEFPYIMDASIHDTRRSDVCAWFAQAGIDGSNIYRADDLRYRQYPPARHYNCRSGRVWLSIKDAAARGVKEAIEWERTGLPPANPYRMPEPPPEVLKRMFAGQTAVAMSLLWDEGEHPRNHGKFAKKGSVTVGKLADAKRLLHVEGNQATHRDAVGAVGGKHVGSIGDHHFYQLGKTADSDMAKVADALRDKEGTGEVGLVHHGETDALNQIWDDLGEDGQYVVPDDDTAESDWTKARQLSDGVWLISDDDGTRMASKPPKGARPAKGKQKTVNDFTEKDRKAVQKANKSEPKESKTPLFFDEENPLLAEKKDGGKAKEKKEPHEMTRDELRKRVQSQYMGPESVVDGTRTAGFTDKQSEADKAKSLGLSIRRAGKFWIYEQHSGDGKELAAALEKHGYGSTSEESKAISRLAGYSDRQQQELDALLNHHAHVEYAIAAGKTVPDEVLKDYPDLARQYALRKQRAKENPLASSLDAAEREARLKPKFTGPDNFTLNADPPAKVEPAAQGRLFSLPQQQAKPVKTKTGWITIGANKEAPKGEKGGTPVYLQGGKIVKGPAALHGRKIANLKADADDQRTHRKQLADSSSYDKARRRKECRAAGVDPKAVEQVGQELRQHDKEQVDEHNALIAHAEKLMGLSSNNKAFKGGDVHTLTKQGRRVDEVAGEIANSGQFAHLFNDSEPPGDQLFAYLEQGRRQYKSDDRIFNAALEFAVEHGLKPKAKESLEPVPFSLRMSMFDENKHPRAGDGKFAAGQGGADVAAVVKQSTEAWREDATPKVDDLAGMDDDDAAEAAEAWKNEIYDAVMQMDESVLKAFDDRFDSDERLTIDDAAETYWTAVHELIDEFMDGDREDEDAQVTLLDAIDDAGSAFVSEVELAVRNAQWMEDHEAEDEDEGDDEEEDEEEEEEDVPEQQGHLFSRRMSNDEPWEIVGEPV